MQVFIFYVQLNSIMVSISLLKLFFFNFNKEFDICVNYLIPTTVMRNIKDYKNSKIYENEQNPKSL